MKLLILGGTRFVGRHVVDAAMAHGHELTLFNRGQTNPSLYPQVETIIGDREGDLAELDGRRFDAVLDIAGYLPRVVRNSVTKLREQTDRYVFVSSISVYSDFSEFGIDESSPLEQLEDEGSEDIAKDYGALKVRCEEIVQEAFPGALIVRPGLIVGPHDHTNRFTYWVTRAARGGRMLAPSPPDRQVQFIHAGDLADWTIRMTEAGEGGIFNVVCPPFPFERLIRACIDVSQSDAEIQWVDPGFLKRHEVEPWDELPVWMPTGDDMDGLMSADPSRAVSQGLIFRSLEDTIEGTLAWASGMDHPPGTAGLDPQREEELLKAWDDEQEGRS